MGDDLNKRGQPSRKTCQHRVENNRQNWKNWWCKRIEKRFCLREWDEQRESPSIIGFIKEALLFSTSFLPQRQRSRTWFIHSVKKLFPLHWTQSAFLLFCTPRVRKEKKIFRRHASWDPIVCYWKGIELDRNIISEKRACGSQQE